MKEMASVPRRFYLEIKTKIKKCNIECMERGMEHEKKSCIFDF